MFQRFLRAATIGPAGRSGLLHPSVTLGTALAMTIIGGLGVPAVWVLQSTLVPLAAHAYEARTNITLELQGGETYSNVVRRAETVARAAAQRSFDRDVLITDVLVVVNVQNATGLAPLLTLRASRPQWSSRPDARRWSTYYPVTQTLLAIPDPPPPPLHVTPLKAIPKSVTPAPQPTVKPLVPKAPTSLPSGSQPNSVPGPQPSPAVPGTTPTNTMPTPQPTRSPLIPQRIPTPAGIGK